MPHIDLNGAHIHFTDTGGDGPAIVFSHGLLMSGEMFTEQVACFETQFRSVTFDHRGQGQSGVAMDGYDLDTLTDDAAALIEHLGLAPCHFVGLSMGGFVGMRLAARRPDLVKTLTLLGTTAEPAPEATRRKYRMLNFVGRWIGLWAVIGSVMPLMFGKTFLNDAARAKDKQRWRQAITGNHRVGITRAVQGVIEDEGCIDLLASINMPVGIGVGKEDLATVPEKSEAIHAAIKGSELCVFEATGHSSSIEAPAQVNDLIKRTIARC